MKEGAPSDKYSREAYEAGLKRLAENEKAVTAHPLQDELKIHEELRKTSESVNALYSMKNEEEAARAQLEQETAEFRSEVEKIKQDLWRQLSNAQAEAIKMNEEMESREAAQAVLPKIAEIESATHHRLEEDSANLPPRAHIYGRAVLEVAEEAKRKLTTEKPAPSATQAMYRALRELHQQFVGFAGNVLAQDRYGNPLGGVA